MRTEGLTFESVARLHVAADHDRQQAGLRAWAAALTGEQTEDDEPRLLLAEIGREFRLHPTWLWRLGIRERCGTRVAGKLRYAKSTVAAFLKSQECKARIHELHDARVRREQAQKVHVALLARSGETGLPNAPETRRRPSYCSEARQRQFDEGGGAT